jgi:hypothetical protein
MVRPEALRFTPGGVPARVTDRRFAGAATFYHLQAEGIELLVQGAPGDAEMGGRVAVAPAPGASVLAYRGEETG